MKLKRILSMIVAIIILACCTVAMAETPLPSVRQQDNAHQIAELARSIGLAEDDPIIARARELWWGVQDQIEKDIQIIATVVYNEAKYCTDEHQLYVASVVVNRVNSDHPSFHDTVYDVVVAPGQYLRAYATEGSYYWNLARNDEAEFERCLKAARMAVYGDTDCPDNVVFQANFTQGSGTFKQIYVPVMKNYTYFCYL